MKVYVGATFSRYEEARAVIDALAGAGHECTHDWTRTDAFGPDGHPLPESGGGYHLPPEEQAAHAENDLDAVYAAEGFVFLAQEPSCGWPIECGAALSLNHERELHRGEREAAPIHVVAPFKPTVFWHLPWVTLHEDVASALAPFGASLETSDSVTRP